MPSPLPSHGSGQYIPLAAFDRHLCCPPVIPPFPLAAASAWIQAAAGRDTAGWLLHQLLYLQRRCDHPCIWRAGRRTVSSSCSAICISPPAAWRSQHDQSSAIASASASAFLKGVQTSPGATAVPGSVAVASSPGCRLELLSLQGKGGAAGGLPRPQGGASADAGSTAGRREYTLHHAADAS